MDKKINAALVSVFNKNGLDKIIHLLHKNNVVIYSTGGTYDFITSLGVPCKTVEDLTSYPSILDGRVKTLHPKVFGGILARREKDHLQQLDKYQIPELDLVVVDLYPFEDTVKSQASHSDIIEKIDIGGVSLIRAAAKNYKDVVVIPSKNEYNILETILEKNNITTDIEIRRSLAKSAFELTTHYDGLIADYFAGITPQLDKTTLRYGENPHQRASFSGDLKEVFTKLSGKDLSYNNLIDVDAAIHLMQDFKDDDPTFAIFKHTNPCGVATRSTTSEAWDAALAGDPISAFGGIFITNSKVELETAEKINKLFYEILIAPDFSADAIDLLTSKKNRILLELKGFNTKSVIKKSLLNGTIEQDTDAFIENRNQFELKTTIAPSDSELTDLEFGIKCVKHLKSNAIAIVKDSHLLGMGCGQTSRVDACKQAIEKAKENKFNLVGAVLASDAFFPFPDCVQIAHEEGITSVIQPGGSVNDKLNIEFCEEHSMSMVFTGVRHFKH